MLKIVKDSAIKARTQAINQMKALMVTAPLELRHELVSLDVSRLSWLQHTRVTGKRAPYHIVARGVATPPTSAIVLSAPTLGKL